MYCKRSAVVATKSYEDEEVEERTEFQKNAFELLGGIEGVRSLASCFYDIMNSLPDARRIRAMHPADLAPTKENFAFFVCGWLGGQNNT